MKTHDTLASMVSETENALTANFAVWRNGGSNPTESVVRN